MPHTIIAQDVANDATNLEESTIYSEEQSPLKVEKLASPRYQAPLSETAKTISVIPQALMKEQNVDTIEDALRNVPGISLTTGEGGSTGGDQLYIRGFDARSDFFIDGVRDIGGYTRDSFNYEQVEVSKGPASADSGRGSTGGSVNLITKNPKLEQAGEISTSFGTDNYLRSTIDYNQPFAETSAFRINLMGHDAEAPGRDYVESSRWGIAPSVAFGIGTDFQATFSYLHMQQDNTPDYGIPWANDRSSAPDGVPFSNYYGLLFRDYEDVTTDILTAEFKYQVHENLSLRSITRYSRNDRESVYTAPRFEDEDANTVRYSDIKARDQVDTIFSTALDLNYDFEAFGHQHQLVTGVDFSSEKQNRKRPEDLNEDDSPVVSIYDPSPYATYTTDFVNTADITGRADTIGFFLYDTIDFTDKWSFSGGFRYDHIESSYKGFIDSDIYDLERTDDIISWRASVNYKPRENGTIYAAYGTSSNPSIENLSLSDDSTGLDPEENISMEIGTKWDLLDGKLGLTAALFRTEKTNAATDAARGEPDFLIGEQIVQGVELGLTGNITDKWSIYGGYVFMESEIKASLRTDELGESLDDTPKHSFSIWNTYEVNDQLAVSGGVRYVGEISNDDKQFGKYLTVDLATRYQIRDDLALSLNIYNVFDKEYIEKDGGGHFIPGAARSANVSLTYTF